MSKVLGKNLRQAVVFGVCPRVRVEPAQLIRCASASGIKKNRFRRTFAVAFGRLIEQWSREFRFWGAVSVSRALYP